MIAAGDEDISRIRSVLELSLVWVRIGSAGVFWFFDIAGAFVALLTVLCLDIFWL